jgi:hypothetical protein
LPAHLSAHHSVSSPALDAFQLHPDIIARIDAPVVGVLGCMGERLKHKLLETDGLADLVAGPDAYRDLPRLIDVARGAWSGGGSVEAAINVQLRRVLSYAGSRTTASAS